MEGPVEATLLHEKKDGIISRARAIMEPWKHWRVQQQAKSSSLHLAHYTSLEAIVSMLQDIDGGLRLSDTSTMNDPEEGRATTESSFILHVLTEEFGTESWLWRRYGAANVCCFVGIEHAGEQTISPGDDLLYWRLYGNDCRGVSITMPPHVASDLEQKSIVNRVTYTDEEPLRIDWREFSALLRDLDELRAEAKRVGVWADVGSDVLKVCDQIFKQRFLRKRSHYEMEREYRTVVFASDEGDNGKFSKRGRHVQYGRVRCYVQIPELGCEKIFTTNSQVTIGSNVPEAENAREAIRGLICGWKTIGGVSIKVSNIAYRPR